jgi:hypothetical protein
LLGLRPLLSFNPRPGGMLSPGSTLPTLSNRLSQGYFGSNTLRFRGKAAARLSSCSSPPGPRGS